MVTLNGLIFNILVLLAVIVLLIYLTSRTRQNVGKKQSFGHNWMQRQYHIPDVPKEVYDALQKVHNAVKAVDISGNNSEFEKVDSILKALNTKELFEFSNLLHKRSFAFARIYLAANRDHTIQIDGATLVIGWGSLHIHVWYDGEYGKEEKNVEGDHAANASTLQSLGLELNSKELKYQILAATTPVQFYTHCVDFKMF